MKRSVLVVIVLILGLAALSLSGLAAPATRAAAEPLLLVALTSPLAEGPGQGRWFVPDWFSYAGGQLQLYPTESGPLAGWTLPGYDDAAWDDHTAIVWDFWWGAPFAQPSIPELGQQAATARQGFVNRATYLYRRSFDLPQAPAGTILRSIQVQAWSDNNAVFYLNGQRVYISSWPAGLSEPFTPEQVNLRPQGNILAVQLCNDDQPVTNPIGVQFRVLLNYLSPSMLCLTHLSPSSPKPEGTGITVSAHAEDARGLWRVRFIINSATDGSYSGTWWRFGDVAAGGATAFDATVSLDWSQAPAGFPRYGTHLIAVNSFYVEEQISERWWADPCRQMPFEWIAAPTATPTATASPTPADTATPTPSVTPSATDTPAPTATLTATPSATPSATHTATPAASATPTQTPTATATVTPSATPSPTLVPSMEVRVSDWHDPLVATWRQRYTITVTNNGQAALTGVVLVDTAPEGADVLMDQSSAGGTYDGGRRVTWPLGTLAPGASATRYLEIMTHSWHWPCIYMTNRVTVSSVQTQDYEADSKTLMIRDGAPPCGLPILP